MEESGVPSTVQLPCLQPDVPYIGVNDEDWSGLSSKERRRIQNRINARAYRRRIAEAAKVAIGERPASSAAVTRGCSRGSPTVRGTKAKLSHSPATTVSPPSDAEAGTMMVRPKTAISFPVTKEDAAVLRRVAARVRENASRIPELQLLGPSRVEQEIREHLLDRLRCMTQHEGSPSLDLLINISTFNVFRAFITIMKYLRVDFDEMSTNTDIQSTFLTGMSPDQLPEDLRPTPEQLSKRHHPVIDCFPDVHLRRELLKRDIRPDDELEVLLLHDLAGVPKEGKEPEQPRLFVWGEPYLIESWEATEDFFATFGDLVNGCDRLIRSSNAWRARRGEEPLRIQEVY